MSALVAALAAAGLVLVVFGLPPLRPIRMGDRVARYLGAGDGLSALTRGATPSRLEKKVTALLPERRDIAHRLAAAGSSAGAATYRLEQVLWGAAGFLGSTFLFLAAAAAGASAEPLSVALVAPIVGMAGFFGRDWWLSRQVEARRARLTDELPTAIDLVTLAVMAGESIPAAFARVATLMPSGIGEELGRSVADMRAGATAVDALEALGRRVPDPAMGRFIDALTTGLERGSPLAEVLRGQADDGREARRRRLIELGGKREVLMLVPVVFLIMPVVVVFALLPGLVSLDLLVP